MKKQKMISGYVKRHPDGFGFLIPDNKEHPDVYIPRHYMEGIMSNDHVVASVEPEKGNDRFRGEILRINKRGTAKVVGHYAQLNETHGLIKDESKSWGYDLKIPVEFSKGARSGDFVAAEITKYPEDGGQFLGKVIEIIGNIEDPLNDIRRIIHAQNIPDEFSAAVQTEAREFKEVPEQKDYAHRKDLRNKDLITIDGATAKDFDDAILTEMHHTGFKLYVAIADVSHYVQPGTAIDKEAYQRGTSVYFPNFVVPMLPEVLSNGLCSLNPHVPRLCLVAEIDFDFSGTVVRSDFYEAVMESKARVTYGKAQEVVDGIEVAELSRVKENILRSADLAKILMAKRFKEGSLDLEIPETQLQIDSGGNPVDVIRSERLFAHRLIEEMMLAANVAVAKFLTEKQVPAIYRIHEPPNEVSIRLLERYMRTFGGSTTLEGGKLQKRLTRALQEFEGKPEALVLHILTLRSMNQAKYARENKGHFGLGFEDYTHFTSPIRRYPDLIVHRLLKNLIMQNSRYRLMSEEALDEAGAWLSACEQRSVKAERQVMSIKKARFMQKFVGEELEGMVSSVTKFGAFVLLRQYDIDGLVRLEDLSAADRWDFDEENLALVARGSGFSIRVGDTMKIIVTLVDVVSGQINFSPVQAIASRRLDLTKKNIATTDKEQNGNSAETQVRKPWERGKSSPSAPSSSRDFKRHERDKKKNRRDRPPRDEKPNSKSRFEDKAAAPSQDKKRKVKTSGARSLFDVINQSLGKVKSSGNESESNWKNPKERGSDEENRRGLRKTRLSQRRGEGEAGKVSSRKAERKRRR